MTTLARAALCLALAAALAACTPAHAARLSVSAHPTVGERPADSPSWSIFL